MFQTNARNLFEFAKETLATVDSTRDRVRKARIDRGYVEKADFLADIRKAVAEALPADIAALLPSFEIAFVERSSFQSDVTFRSTELIKADKNRYLSEICHALADALKKVEKDGLPLFESVEQKAIYVNAKFAGNFLFSRLSAVETQGEKFGENSSGKGSDVVLDYSSPNAAKHLHAGHIRSTIIGHVLGNFAEACGYSAHRINYLNDWGGVGFLLEGLDRRKTEADSFENKNDFLASIYSGFRKGQKFSTSAEEFSKMTDEDRRDIAPLFGNAADFETLKTAFADFKSKSDARFAALENGSETEFASWKTVIEWSMIDFEKFYALLDIHQDYLTGESLYAGLGKALVKNAVETGEAVFFDRAKADAETAKVAAEQAAGTLSEEVAEKLKGEIESDIGGYVVHLANHERYVVMKGNESTIYATRDLAALKHRAETFRPARAIYEVGQEQQDHFAKLFESSKMMGFGEGIELCHVYHGFYVNEETKKKLSSRDGASNIMKLLSNTVAYFEAKYSDSPEFGEEEKRETAKALAIGSIVFNDLKRDKKSPVGIPNDLEKAARSFEEAGGAYVVYASCRAKSIMRKYDKPIPSIAEALATGVPMLDVEADLIKKILEFPDVVEKAATGNDPVRVTEYLLKLAGLYNAYYNAVPVLKGENVEYRLALSKALARTIDNGLSLLHVKPLERI